MFNKKVPGTRPGRIKLQGRKRPKGLMTKTRHRLNIVRTCEISK